MQKNENKLASKEIKDLFLKFFTERGHLLVPSAPLVPQNDKSLLFTNSGMVQFKDTFLGEAESKNSRVVTCQRCLRAGGKHNDLENVGFTARHHTYFEMLGNFSFGDYFKEKSIVYAWELLTEIFKIDEKRLVITVYERDEETYRIWKDIIKVGSSRILKIGDNQGGSYCSDNFWQMAETGPCGPSTEIFFDNGADIKGGLPGSKDEGERFVEIWNLVFMQYNRGQDGELNSLPIKCVDTGMGLERIAAVLQGVRSNYETDTFTHLIRGAAKALNYENLDSVSLRVIADHIRAIFYLIFEGVYPSNEGRGYVLRRIIRRAIRHGYKCGVKTPFLTKVVDYLVKDAGKEMFEDLDTIERIKIKISNEEEKFNLTFLRGMDILLSEISDKKKKILSGSTAFVLYDTYGFPVDMTADICKENQVEINMSEFNTCMTEQRNRSKSSSKFESILEINDNSLETEFLGYSLNNVRTKVTAIFKGSEQVHEILEGESGTIVLEQSCFYPEAGGQIGDIGIISSTSGELKVLDTKKKSNMILHKCLVNKGSLKNRQAVSAVIDSEKRSRIMRNHSATHLLHYALRKTLGSHVQQKGSLVNHDRTRFDFSHEVKLSESEIVRIESTVNEIIRQNEKTKIENMTISEAIKYGAIALFGEKYGDFVRVLKIGPSIELCGGTHVSRTGDIGVFKILSEGSISSGIRRIEAVAGKSAEEYIGSIQQIVRDTGGFLQVSSEKIVDKICQTLEESKKKDQTIVALKQEQINQQKRIILKELEKQGDTKILACVIRYAGPKDIRAMTDEIKLKYKKFALVFGSVNSGKVTLISRVSEQLLHLVSANEVLKTTAEIVGGKGGGRPDFAQAGGNDPEKLNLALEKAEKYFYEKLGD